MPNSAKRMSRLNRLCEKHRVLLVCLFGSQKDAGLKCLNEQKVHIEETSDLDIECFWETRM